MTVIQIKRKNYLRVKKCFGVTNHNIWCNLLKKKSMWSDRQNFKLRSDFGILKVTVNGYIQENN